VAWLHSGTLKREQRTAKLRAVLSAKLSMLPASPMPHDLLECLSRSAQGEVWRARDRETGGIVAVKKPGGLAGLVAIRHPHVVRVLECDAEEMVMEWIEGESLDKLVPLDPSSFEALVHQTLSGLAAIHEAGFLHLDLKPENILQGARGFVLIDLGSAKPLGDARADLKGSVHFMAPECFQGGRLDERTDLYALGCVFYFALTKRLPFEGELAPQVITAHLQHRVEPLEGVLGEWIGRLMARKPADRPAKARAALAEYAAIA
jgi:serine/threonine-protein kinase